MTKDDIKTQIQQYIVREFLPGEDPANIDSSVRLVTDGILNSMASLKLVGFLEESFGTTLEAHEVDADHLDDIDGLADLVAARRG